ncbi:glycosyltransferase family 4 protein [Halosimplex amylolyticum]|uniref:glycosyltransferase family 4 protein n=1 Tax=Halosimplex amylolyticum TaxID=3396616 RepID=UPI003F54E896
MRIGFVYDAVYPWETGGVQKRIWEVARRLAGRHDVHWYGLHYWDGPVVVEREGVTLHGVCEATDLYVDGRRKISEALSFAAQVLPELLRADLDVIDCQAFPYFPGFPSRLSASLRGGTLCVTWHEVWDDYWYDYLGRKGVFGKAIEKLLGHTAHTNVAVSERTRRDLEGRGARCDHLVPNGIDRQEIDAVPSADESVDLLFAGRFIPEKNPMLVVETVNRLRRERPDIQCWMVGEGPEHSRVEAAVESRGLSSNIELPGFLDEYEDVLGLMKAADAFILPSRREGFGITVLEALACGTPVVTLRHPQNAAMELVTDGETGRIVDADPDALATAVREVRSVPADACIESTAAYEWDAIAERSEAVYREVI